MKPETKKKVIFSLTKTDHVWLKEIAQKNGRTMSGQLSAFIRASYRSMKHE